MDWILHADLATDIELEVVAEAGVRLMPTMAFLQRGAEVGAEFGRGPREMDRLKRHWRAPGTCCNAPGRWGSPSCAAPIAAIRP